MRWNNHYQLVVLIILDGWGIAPPSPGNAITLANPITINHLSASYPFTKLRASGHAVGLPDNQVGNSETGHSNIGAGRIVESDSIVIDRAIAKNTFFKNTALLETIKHVKKHHSALHLMGLLALSPSAHADPGHLYALLKLTEQQKIKKVFLHLFTDGRDSSPHGSINAINKLKEHLPSNTKIATIIGRFYAMDRKKNWARLEKAYNLLASGKGIAVHNAEEAISQAYNRQETDEFISPSVIVENKKPVATINDHDALIYFNLRSDRARQFSKIFVQDDFNQRNPNAFRRKKVIKNLCFVALTDFGPDLDSILTAFPSQDLKNTLPMCLSNFRQLYITETEKYAHMTYFFNGGYADPVAGETRICLPSPTVISYKQVPQMKVEELTQLIDQQIKEREFNFIAVNFPNADMIGHTGDLSATIKAIKCVDQAVKQIVKTVKMAGGTTIITADHGNAEEMINLETNEIETNHTANLVPFILVNDKYKTSKLKANGKLADIAPTILQLFKISKPSEMTGHSLIISKKNNERKK